jgi:protein-disulfide isomerase
MRLKMKLNNKWSYIVAIGFSVIILILIGVRIAKYRSTNKTRIAQVNIQEERPLDIVFGNHDAKLSIYMYSSYSCSYCTLFFTDVFPELEKEYINSGEVKLILRLTVKSNNIDIQNAMKTAVCINKYGNYEYLHELLLNDSKVVVTHEFRDMVNSFIDKDIYVAECILGNEAEEYLNKNVQDYETLKLKGTPTFIIGNKIYTGYQDYEKFEQIITHHLNESHLPN